jgi:Zn-finger nucleic acid-binding protein
MVYFFSGTAMSVLCPKCHNLFKPKDPGDIRDAPMAVCPKCRHVFFIKEPSDNDPFLTEDQAEETGIPLDIYRRSRQAKRYLLLVLVLFLVVVAYQVSQYLLSEFASNEIRNTIAKSVLKAVAQAQEAYYAEHGQYADESAKIKDLYRENPDVTVTIDHGDARFWTARAYHRHASSGVIYHSSQGGIQIDYCKREDAISQ